MRRMRRLRWRWQNTRVLWLAWRYRRKNGVALP
jgi:hypothetical protein